MMTGRLCRRLIFAQLKVVCCDGFLILVLVLLLGVSTVLMMYIREFFGSAQ